MNQIIAKVVAADLQTVTLEVDPQSTCERCATGKGCGAGLAFGSGGSRSLIVPRMPDTNVVTGDIVRLCLQPQGLLRAAVLAYGVPLFGALAGLLLAGAVRGELGDAEAAVAAMAGAFAGFFGARRELRRHRSAASLMPSIAERMSAVTPAVGDVYER